MERFHPATRVEALDVDQTVAYNWEYDNDRQRLVRLYENAKRDQWNGTDRLDWSIDVDPESEVIPDLAIGIYGTPMWQKLTPSEVKRLRHEALPLREQAPDAMERRTHGQPVHREECPSVIEVTRGG